MSDNTLEEQIFELISYIVVSARNLLEEPARYGPFRLIDTAGRLIEILEKADMAGERLTEIRNKIDAGKLTAMGDEREFQDFLDSLVFHLVDEVGPDGD